MGLFISGLFLGTCLHRILPGEGEARADYTVNEEGSSLSIADPNGFRSVIGSVDLETPRTGERHKTSAASVVLFGKDGKLLWSAP
jgi:hypothetical protein